MKTCFVICPIGGEGTKIRRQSDSVFEYIIKPALDGTEYDPVRVDKADKPTHITTEIIKNLIHADLVIADLSDTNPNVFYELGIRHAFQRPCILLADGEKQFPFDVAHINTIKYVYDDPQSHKSVCERIRQQISELERNINVSNPVTVALGFEKLSESGDSRDQIIISLADKIDRLQSKVNGISSQLAIEKVVNALAWSETNALAAPGRNALAGLYGAPNLEIEPDSLADILARHLDKDA